MPDNSTVLVGNLTADPELRHTQSGVPVCNMRIAVNEWRGKDNEPATTFWTVNIWRDQADHAAATFVKGDRVIVCGTLKQRSYDNSDGQKVDVVEVEATEVGGSVKFDTWQKGSRPVSASSSSGPAAPPPSDNDVPF